MDYQVHHCGIVVLAAGQSSRLGSPKQLLNYKGISLVMHTVTVALATAMRPVVVVVGANSEAVEKELEGTAVMVVENKEWAEGMASSLRAGLMALKNAAPEHDGAIFMVCDQPYVTKGLLDSLRNTQAETRLPAVASSYAGKMGTPALFHRAFFPELLQLQGDTGARKLLVSHAGEVASVPFEAGSMDIDTPEDYARLVT